MKVSVILCTKNRLEDLTKCIESISIQSHIPHEIIIVDSSETNELERILEQIHVSIEIPLRYIHKKASLTQARNIGIKTSKGNIIIFLDDDVILDKYYVKEIVNVFENDEKKRIGGVTGTIINMMKPENSSFIKRGINSIMYSLRIIFLLPRNNSNGKFLPSGHPTGVFVKNKIVEREHLSGANMAFRREVLNKFKFDENLQGYCFMEDCDISYRVSRKYKTVLTPNAKLIHNLSPVARDKEYNRMKMVIENHYYLFKKNFPQDFMHKFAFWWSVIGLFVMEATGRNKEGLRGLINGIIYIKRQKKNSELNLNSH